MSWTNSANTKVKVSWSEQKCSTWFLYSENRSYEKKWTKTDNLFGRFITHLFHQLAAFNDINQKWKNVGDPRLLLFKPNTSFTCIRAFQYRTPESDLGKYSREKGERTYPPINVALDVHGCRSLSF